MKAYSPLLGLSIYSIYLFYWLVLITLVTWLECKNNIHVLLACSNYRVSIGHMTRVYLLHTCSSYWLVLITLVTWLECTYYIHVLSACSNYRVGIGQMTSCNNKICNTLFQYIIKITKMRGRKSWNGRLYTQSTGITMTTELLINT